MATQLRVYEYQIISENPVRRWEPVLVSGIYYGNEYSDGRLRQIAHDTAGIYGLRNGEGFIHFVDARTGNIIDKSGINHF